jgi:hypothetical protein
VLSTNEKRSSLQVALLKLTDMTSSCKVNCGVRGVGTKSADDEKIEQGDWERAFTASFSFVIPGIVFSIGIMLPHMEPVPLHDGCHLF